MNLKTIILAALIIFVFAQSYIIIRGADSSDPVLSPKLSDYHIFEGKLSDLKPQKDFTFYELATTLFTDYAEKQRLVKIPAGTVIKITGDGLPDFPDGAMLVKTFFYFNDKRNTAKGKRIMETRLLLKNKTGWHAGTYVWNAGQDDAVLAKSAADVNVEWLDGDGRNNSVNYQIPSKKQCGTCHNAGRSIMPIGFKTMNLNIDVIRNNQKINQLTYFIQNAIFNSVNPASFTTLPDWQNHSSTLAQRARAYIEVNCAHCHSDEGYCSASGFRAGYGLTLQETGFSKKRTRIINMMKSGRMPMIGTTVVHKEGLELIREYANSLQ